MKKLLLVSVVVVALALAIVGLTSANGGPHGDYTATTDACAGCHRAHTATGAKLLVAADTYTLCMTCHGSTGTGADTNVADGYFLSTRSSSTTGTANTTDNAALLGGGFTNYKGAATTSKHDADGTAAAAWGNGVNRGVTAALTGGNLTCASCHDPHGSANYRIIKATVNATVVSVAQVDEAAKDYDTEKWGTGQSSICAACHGAYHKIAANQGSTVDAGTYTHRIDMQWDAAYAGAANPESTGMGGFKLPLALTDSPVVGDGVVACQTCHLPHGSSAAMTGNANSGALPGNTSATDSALLRLDNRGVCEVCHQK